MSEEPIVPKAVGAADLTMRAASLAARPGFLRFWLASALSDAGSYVGALALSVLVVLGLGGGPADVGLVSAARWLPYPALGLLVGMWVDRFGARQMMALADLGRATTLVILGGLGIVGVLSIPMVMLLMFVVGLLALISDAAFQALVPQLVERHMLTRANARLEQTGAVAQTVGPALSGIVVQLLTAPIALLLNALAYTCSGLLVLAIRLSGARAGALSGVGTIELVREGLGWVYRHRTIRPLATSTAAWFAFASMFAAVFAVYALRDLGVDASGLGLLLGVAGGGAVVGSLVSTTLESRLRLGRSVILGRSLHPVAFGLIYLAPVETAAGDWIVWLLVGSGQFLHGLGLGIEGPLELGYRQAVTPARLIARTGATLRSLNRTMLVAGAAVGGMVAEVVGSRTSLALAAVGMLLAVALLAFSAFRQASTDDAIDEES